MNLMPEIIKKLGVEIGEKFDVTDTFGNIVVKDVMFSEENGSLISDHFTGFYIDTLLAGILKGECIILKRPWKPKDEEIYYHVKVSGKIGHYYYRKDTIDATFLYMGNCFRTREEAEAHKEEVLQKMQEAWGDSE